MSEAFESIRLYCSSESVGKGRPNKSVYTLNMNPKGTVNIKIVRDTNSKITGITYMTEAEVIELLGDMDDSDDKTGVEIIPVDFKTVAAGETIFLGEYTLSDEIGRASCRERV